MNSAPRKSEANLPERKILTSLNTFRPLSQRALDELDSASQVPTSIPSLKSALISPVAKNHIATRDVEASILAEKNSLSPLGEVSGTRSPTISAD